MFNKILCLFLALSSFHVSALSLKDAGHLLRRTEFGPSVESLENILNLNRAQAAQFILNKDPQQVYEFQDYERLYNNRVQFQANLDNLKLRLQNGDLSEQEFQAQNSALLQTISYRPEGSNKLKVISKSDIRKGLINLDNVIKKIVKYETAVQALPTASVEQFKIEHKRLTAELLEALIEDYRKYLFLTEDNNNDQMMEPKIRKHKDRIMGYISIYNIKAAFHVFGKRFLKADYLQALWIDKMLESPAPIQEVMTLFWHDHFATRIKDRVAMAYQNHTLRKNALGSFRQMLYDMSEDKALLRYLDATRNIKSRPNENFARELLELFTLGEEGGHYTEADVRSAARAFTGYNSHPAGKKSGLFVFYPKKHDAGEKVFLGQTGNFNKRDIIDILLNQKQTARYITEKLWVYFINPETNYSQALINQWADEFYNSDYDIKLLLKRMLSSSAFYNSRSLLIKNPMDFLIGTARTFRYEIDENTLKELGSQAKGLGQKLFRPPNVSGWKGHIHWINPVTLTKRRKALKAVLFTEQELEHLADQRRNFMRAVKWNYYPEKKIDLPSVQVNSSQLFEEWISFFKSRGENLKQAWQSVLLPIAPRPHNNLFLGRINKKGHLTAPDYGFDDRRIFHLNDGNISYQLVDSYMQDVVYQLK